MNAIAKHEVAALAMPESDLLKVLGDSLYPGARDDSIRMVLGYCTATSLDPMQKPVHIVPMWDKNAKCMRDVVMPGIGLYRTQAARTGEHAGTDEPEFGPMVQFDLDGTVVNVPEWCKVTVYRLKGGLRCPFTATEFWIENYATAAKDTSAPNAMWKKRSRGQLSKCAEAQALRRAFPEVGSQPTAEEMEGKSHADAADVVAAPRPPAPPPAVAHYPADKFIANLPAWSKAIAAGKKTADEIIAFVESKQPLTDAQKAEIRKANVIEASPAASTNKPNPTE